MSVTLTRPEIDLVPFGLDQPVPDELWVLALPGEQDTIVCNFDELMVRAWLTEVDALTARLNYPKKANFKGSEKTLAEYWPVLKTFDELKAEVTKCLGVLLTTEEWQMIARRYWR